MLMDIYEQTKTKYREREGDFNQPVTTTCACSRLWTSSQSPRKRCGKVRRQRQHCRTVYSLRTESVLGFILFDIVQLLFLQ
jgi:hypothetical protein